MVENQRQRDGAAVSGDAMQGRVALVTGAASGLGTETAAMFAREGADAVFACDTRAEPLQEAVDRLRGEGLKVEAIVLDVSDEEAWASAIGEVEQQAGRLDALVNNAGLSGTITSGGQFGTEYWHRLVAVNLTGPFFGMRAAWPLLRTSGSGSIVNISSVGGVVGIRGIHAGYIASKGGLRTLTKGMALEMAPDNIRVNSVHPGAMPAMQGSNWDADDPEQSEALRRLVPLGRQADHSEVAEAVLFLNSPRSSYITGVELYVDGGWLAH